MQKRFAECEKTRNVVLMIVATDSVHKPSCRIGNELHIGFSVEFGLNIGSMCLHCFYA